MGVTQGISLSVEVDVNQHWGLAVHHGSQPVFSRRVSTPRSSVSTASPRMTSPRADYLQTRPRSLIPAPLPPTFRIAPPTQPLIPMASTASHTLTPTTFPSQRSVPASCPCLASRPRILPDTPEEPATDDNDEETALTKFQHWLSLFPESAIPMSVREALS